MKGLQLTRPLVSFDFETTSKYPKEARIIEYCFRKHFPEGNIEIITGLLNPGIPIPAESTEVHGYTDDDVKCKPIFMQKAKEFTTFLTDCDFSGFNIKYDMKVIANEFKRYAVKFSFKNTKWIDSMGIFHRYMKRNLSLAHLIYKNKELTGAHGAKADTIASDDVLEAQLEHHNLPRTIDKLHIISNSLDKYVDYEKKFIWNKNGHAVFAFSKHKDKMLQYIAEMEPGFLKWIIDKDFPEETKKICREALYGKFPIKPAINWGD